MKRSLAFLFGLSVLLGCDSGADPADGGSSLDGSSLDAAPIDAGLTDAGEPSDAGPGPDGALICGDPDLSCPASLPHPGAPCRGDLSCEYPDTNGMWTYTCPAGRWESTSTCTAPPGGTCPVPPLGESCDTPFTGTLSGATIEVGPAGSDAFRSFTDRELLSLIFGGQGSPMISYRVRVNGVDVPDCVRMVTTLTPSIEEPISDPRTIRLRCGESLGILGIVAGESCPSAPVETQLEVAVTGVGTATLTVLLPAEAFCPTFGG